MPKSGFRTLDSRRCLRGDAGNDRFELVETIQRVRTTRDKCDGAAHIATEHRNGDFLAVRKVANDGRAVTQRTLPLRAERVG